MSLARKHDNLSVLRIIGFACNQGFVYFLFYMGLNRPLALGEAMFERVDLFGTLLFMVVAFMVMKAAPERLRDALLSPFALAAYALMLIAGSFLIALTEAPTIGMTLVGSFLLGSSCAFLLGAWGKVFGGVSTALSVPEVFLGSVVGAMFGLIVSLIPLDSIIYLLYLQPLGSAAVLIMEGRKEEVQHQPGLAYAARSDTALLSAKIIAGTALFGMAAGFMETFKTDPGFAAMASYPASLLLFGAFGIGSLTLLLSDASGKGTALNKAYRLALFMMMMGFLLIPVPLFEQSMVPGESIVLAGYLSLSAVLISLFLVLAKLTGTDAVQSFSRGFAALFGGELVGVGLANVANLFQPGFETPYSVVVFAGVLVLFSYVFLFTERDFGSLSEIVSKTDTFEDACRSLAEEYGLSNREAEILPFALKGRTSERISQEMHISKSTVDTHLRRIYSKAGVHTRQELIDLGEQHQKR